MKNIFNVCDFCETVVLSPKDGTVVYFSSNTILVRSFKEAMDGDICMCNRCVSKLKNLRAFKDL